MKKCEYFLPTPCFQKLNVTRACLATIFGANSEYPCPICLIPKDEMYALGGIWPIQTKQAVDEMLSWVFNSQNHKEQWHILKEQSMCYVEVILFLADILVYNWWEFCRVHFLVNFLSNLSYLWHLSWMRFMQLSRVNLVNTSGLGCWSVYRHPPKPKSTPGRSQLIEISPLISQLLFI